VARFTPRSCGAAVIGKIFEDSPRDLPAKLLALSLDSDTQCLVDLAGAWPECAFPGGGVCVKPPGGEWECQCGCKTWRCLAALSYGRCSRAHVGALSRSLWLARTSGVPRPSPGIHGQARKSGIGNFLWFRERVKTRRRLPHSEGAERKRRGWCSRC
jgi:hypothetical protein